MFKKSCLTLCLLTSVALATTNPWSGTFVMEDGSTIRRTSEGRISTISAKGEPDGPVLVLALPRMGAKDESDRVVLESTFTPHAFKKALEEFGNIRFIHPPALEALLSQPETAVGSTAPADMERFALELKQQFGVSPTEKEKASWAQMLEAAKTYKAPDNQIMGTSMLGKI